MRGDHAAVCDVIPSLGLCVVGQELSYCSFCPSLCRGQEPRQLILFRVLEYVKPRNCFIRTLNRSVVCPESHLSITVIWVRR